MPAKPGLNAPLDDHDRPRLVDVEDRHAVDGARPVVAGGRVGDVVGADDQRDVGLGELGVDLVHVEQPVVGDVRLR